MGLLNIFKPKSQIAAVGLAQRLFSVFVLAEESSVMRSQDDGLKATTGFQLQKYERQRFIYLAASVAIALTSAASRDKAVIQVIPHFRKLVAAEMLKRWRDGSETVAAEVEQASSDYGALLFENPQENRALSLEWSKGWLARVGVQESNPATLFLMSVAWREQFLMTARALHRTAL